MRLVLVSLFAAAGIAAATPASAQFDWTGFYAGVHGGLINGDVTVEEQYEYCDLQIDQICEISLTSEGGDGGGPISGLIGGGLAGYNLQNGHWVYGFEADFGITDAHGTGRVESEYDFAYDLNWNAHLRGRAGIATGNTLFFLAGGWAMASHTLTQGYEIGDGDDTKTHYGLSFGGGVDHAVTDTLVLRLEGLLDFYGPQTYVTDIEDEFDVQFHTATIRAAIIGLF